MRTSIDKRGRVTIPLAVREAVGLAAGSSVRIELDAGVVCLVRVTPHRVYERIGEGDRSAMLDYDGPRIPIEDLGFGAHTRRAR